MKRFIFVLFIILNVTSVEAGFRLPSPSLIEITQTTPKAAYISEHLILTGFDGPGIVEIYSIIGNKINEIKSQNLKDFKTYMPLQKGNMYIIRVQSLGEVYTLKIIASH